MIRMRLHLWYLGYLVGVVIGLTLAVTGASAQDDAAFVTHRQKVMQSIGGHMGAIGEIMKNKLPYQGTIAAHAQALQMTSTVIEDAFEKEIAAGKTDAKPDIWQDWEKFVAAAKKLGEESGQLAQVAQSGDMAAIGAQVKALGTACGDCHKPFRKPKEESYKR
jgi:cytochrome c556